MSTSTETRINSELFVKPLPNSTKFLLLNDADWPIAEVYTEADAEQLASEHNGFQLLAQRLESQASALVRVVGERDRLRKVLEMMICYGCHNRIGWNETPTKYGDWTKCSSCREARALLTTLITTGQEEG